MCFLFRIENVWKTCTAEPGALLRGPAAQAGPDTKKQNKTLIFSYHHVHEALALKASCLTAIEEHHTHGADEPKFFPSLAADWLFTAGASAQCRIHIHVH